LILLTNDGELANRLTHPRYEHEKEYKVLVAVRPDEEQLAAWRRGVVLPDVGKTAPARVTLISTEGKGAWLRVVMHEGKKRQIREVGRTIGIPVVRIIRVRIATLLLSDLKTGQSRELSDSEVAALRASTQEKSRSTFRSPKPRFPGANKR
jgi:23S rRNA pseudouridine2605 synthase